MKRSFILTIFYGFVSSFFFYYLSGCRHKYWPLLLVFDCSHYELLLFCPLSVFWKRLSIYLICFFDGSNGISITKKIVFLDWIFKLDPFYEPYFRQIIHIWNKRSAAVARPDQVRNTGLEIGKKQIINKNKQFTCITKKSH